MRRILTAGVFIVAVAGLWLGAASCGNGEAFSRASASLDPEPLFPADVGPDTIDVTSYPVIQQENYTLFVEKCSLCHTLARAINSPLVDASTWTRYVKRMHGKNQARSNGGPLLSGDEAKRVISFLTFDSRERKIKRADEFQAHQSNLRNQFDRNAQERTKKKMAESRKASQESAPYVGDR
jgi:hypothetical protein